MKYAKIFIPILILLGIAYFFFDKGIGKKPAGTFATIGEYFFVEPSQVDRVELSDGTTSILVVRNDANWNLELPIKAPADAEIMKNLVDSVLQNAVHRILSSEEAGDLTEYGLESSQKSITLYGGETSKLDLKFGDVSLTGSDIYAKKSGGGEVLLTAIQINDVLQFDPNYYRAKNPIQVDENSIESMVLTYPENIWKLEKKQDTGTWYITEPQTFRANNSKISRLIGQLNSMKIVKFFGSKLLNDPINGFDAPVVKLEIVMKKKSGPETLAMELGGTDVPSNGIYAKLSNIPDEDVLVEASILDKLMLKPDDLREDSLFIIDPAQIISLDVRERDAKNLSVFQDDKGEWKMLSPTSGDVAKSALENFFTQMKNLRPSGFISVEELNALDEEITGFESYTAKIVVKRKGGFSNMEIIIGSKDREKGYYMKVSDADGAYFVSAKLVDEFLNANKRLKGE
jgi:hypothetical protein